MLPKMVLAADGILKGKDGKIILIKRIGKIFKGYWAIPGGTVELNETVEEALIREMWEETGVTVTPTDILGVFSAVDRDPRGRVISTVFICTYQGTPKPGSDAGEIKNCTIEEALNLELAFDHNQILKSYQRWLTQRGSYWSNKIL
ncbi:MAG: NUDIX domain-containing protein [Candidatus Hodarchaeota archaeon]